MVENEIHVGDAGTTFRVTVMEDESVVDISGATLKELIFKGPAGSALIKAASFVTDGVDGGLGYTTLATDFSVAGRWQVQAHVTLVNGEWHSGIIGFMVEVNLT